MKQENQNEILDDGKLIIEEHSRESREIMIFSMILTVVLSYTWNHIYLLYFGYFFIISSTLYYYFYFQGNKEKETWAYAIMLIMVILVIGLHYTDTYISIFGPK